MIWLFSSMSLLFIELRDFCVGIVIEIGVEVATVIAVIGVIVVVVIVVIKMIDTGIVVVEVI